MDNICIFSFVFINMIGYADVFKALGDTTRIEILSYLRDGLEHSCGEVSSHFDLAQPTMCHHFKVLKDAAIIESRKVGNTVMYCLRQDCLDAVGLDLDKW